MVYKEPLQDSVETKITLSNFLEYKNGLEYLCDFASQINNGNLDKSLRNKILFIKELFLFYNLNEITKDNLKVDNMDLRTKIYAQINLMTQKYLLENSLNPCYIDEYLKELEKIHGKDYIQDNLLGDYSETDNIRIYIFASKIEKSYNIILEIINHILDDYIDPFFKLFKKSTQYKDFKKMFISEETLIIGLQK